MADDIRIDRCPTPWATVDARAGVGWRARQESNPRPDGPKPPALSAELRARVSRSNRAENWTPHCATALRQRKSVGSSERARRTCRGVLVGLASRTSALDGATQ